MTICTDIKCACGASVHIEYNDDDDPPEIVTCDRCSGVAPSEVEPLIDMWDLTVSNAKRKNRHAQ
ncbi:MAG: hypothetical protein RL538_376 [Candidatus Parcubacteria bacterium]|jgi:hypothetical protein